MEVPAKESLRAVTKSRIDRRVLFTHLCKIFMFPYVIKIRCCPEKNIGKVGMSNK